MSFPTGPWYIDDLYTFTAISTVFATGVATDADAVLPYRVYEDETSTPILTGNMALLDSANTAGFYSEQITLSAANGFEVGKTYSIHIAGTVSSVVGATSGGFKVIATPATALTAAQIATGVWQDATAGDFTTASSIGKSLYTSGVVPGGTNGLFIAGTNAATTITTSLTTTFTGNLTGSVASVTGAVGSVTGAVGSVTGAVGSVTGNVGGNVTGSVGSVVGAVGSVTGAVGSVTGNVGGNVTGSVGSVVGAVGSVTGNVGGNVTGSVGSVVGAVGSVTGAVGSVTGNVGGNVVGSVGSVVAGVTLSGDFTATMKTSLQTELATVGLTASGVTIIAGVTLQLAGTGGQAIGG